MNWNAIIFGARGYTGLETCKRLLDHPKIKNLTLVSNNKKWRLSDDYFNTDESKISYITREQFQEIDNFNDDFIFLACSAQAAFEVAPLLVEKNARVIDLSGGHRLSKSEAKEYYQVDQDNPFFTDEKIYGLVPFAKEQSRFVANPGCYVSSVLMAIIPLLKEGIISEKEMVIDSKSGTTGAGRTPKDLTHFSELSNSVNPYKVGGHQHFPEICRFAKYFANSEIHPRFTTTLLPIRRGILSTIYTKLNDKLNINDINNAYKKHYQDYQFVKVSKLDGSSEDNNKLALRNVINTNYTHICFYLNGDELTLFSMIDNLVKGASGQAIENMNAMMGIDTATGL